MIGRNHKLPQLKSSYQATKLIASFRKALSNIISKLTLSVQDAPNFDIKINSFSTNYDF